jgi:hypothetical protein
VTKPRSIASKANSLKTNRQDYDRLCCSNLEVKDDSIDQRSTALLSQDDRWRSLPEWESQRKSPGFAGTIRRMDLTEEFVGDRVALSGFFCLIVAAVKGFNNSFDFFD